MHANSRSHEIEDRSTIGVCTVIIFCEFKNCERIREINTYCINTNCVYDHNKKYVLFLRIFFTIQNTGLCILISRISFV